MTLGFIKRIFKHKCKLDSNSFVEETHEGYVNNDFISNRKTIIVYKYFHCKKCNRLLQKQIVSSNIIDNSYFK